MVDSFGTFLKNARIQEFATVPSPTLSSQIICMTADNGGLLAGHIYVRNTANTAWVDLNAVIDTSSFMTASSTNTLTNKTIDANGTGNSISNLEVADFASSAIDMDLSSVSANDDTIPSAKAVKAYIDGLIASGTNYAGVHDASGGAIPSATSGTGVAGAIRKGDLWKISVAGTITGIGTLQVGDVIIANTAAATAAAEFDGLQANVDAASTTVAGLVQLATALEAVAKSNSTKAVTPAALTSFARMESQTLDADGTTIDFLITHGLGKAVGSLIVTLTDATTNELVIPSALTAVDTDSFTLSLGAAGFAYPNGGSVNVKLISL